MLADRTRWTAVDDPRLSALTEGRLVRVQVKERPILFVRMNGELRAMADRCPHQGMSFVDG